jgi:FkbM family methyltransferase
MNIFLNNLSSKITALNIAVHDSTVMSHLHVSGLYPGSSLYPGKAGNSFEEPIGSDHKTFVPVFEQGVIGMSLDYFQAFFDAPFPNHIKIDVDGNEHIIVKGMEKILSDPRCKSIAIELDLSLRTGIDVEICQNLEKLGFKCLTEDRFKKDDLFDKRDLMNYFFVRE